MTDRASERGAADAAGRLGFPDVPRLELDELLVQLVDRAGDVLAAQGRLRGLLRANALVAGELSLPVVLRQIVVAARDLLGARYAALGVLGRDGELEQFVHVGMDDAQVAAIGDLPRGRGVLGLLISDPAPIRLEHLSSHPAAAGFPPGHPPMSSFVGVPVRIGEEIFGNLYLTERIAGGGFSKDDEELAIALAAAAGAAIANARRYAESEQRRRWLDASAQLTPLLLADHRKSPHALIAAHAADAADADFAVLTVPQDPDQVTVTVTGAAGPLATGLLGRQAPLTDSLAGLVIRSGRQCLVTGDRLESIAALVGTEIGPLIAVPLVAGERVLGALLLGRTAARTGYTESDLGMAATFAGDAAVAMELASARADQVLLAQAEDHERIAGDLHDHVIQELFALGMKLQGQAARSDPATADRINGYIETLDEVIKKIRASIFGLQQPRQPPASLHSRVMEIIDDHAPQLGFTAGVSFAIPSATGLDETLVNDILAVTREALSNCARHAHASAVSVSLTLQDGLITLDVTDNGRGLGAPTRSSGLGSMRRRAENNGGTLQITTPADGGTGTRIIWTARPVDE
jgi:signal transduction histidine kinase